MEVTAYECPYSILGVEKDADTDEIKRMFRELSKKHHPDTGGDSAVYARITWAYTILKDDERRRAYDTNQSVTGEPTIDQKAYSLIGHIFTDLLNEKGDEILYLDIVDKIDDAIANGISRIKANQKQIRDRLIVLKSIEERMYADNGVSNVFLHTIRNQQSELEKKKIAVEKDAHVYKRALEMLDSFEFTPKSKSSREGNFSVYYA